MPSRDTVADNRKQPRIQRQSDRVATKCSDTRRLRSCANIDKTTDDDDNDETAINDNCCTESNKIQSDDEEEFIFLQ